MEILIEHARDIADKIGELPPIPSVILKTITLLNDPGASISEIQDQILLDPALTAFLLKVSNSALYSLRKEVSTVSYAVNLIGVNTTKSILMAYLLKNLHTSAKSKFIQNVLWKHSIGAGVFARNIALYLQKVNRKKIDPEEAFVYALLHDIGKSVLLQNRFEEYEKVVHQVCNEDKVSVDAEMEVLGYTHIEVGYLLMKKWNFSDNMVEALMFHHQPILGYRGDSLFVPTISLANKLCHLNDLAFNKKAAELAELEMLNIPRKALEEFEVKCVKDIEMYIKLFG